MVLSGKINAAYLPLLHMLHKLLLRPIDLSMWIANIVVEQLL
jgi:predicted glycosyl hydrolase (DUF1957 family)